MWVGLLRGWAWGAHISIQKQWLGWVGRGIARSQAHACKRPSERKVGEKSRHKLMVLHGTIYQPGKRSKQKRDGWVKGVTISPRLLAWQLETMHAYFFWVVIRRLYIKQSLLYVLVIVCMVGLWGTCKWMHEAWLMPSNRSLSCLLQLIKFEGKTFVIMTWRENLYKQLLCWPLNNECWKTLDPFWWHTCSPLSLLW